MKKDHCIVIGISGGSGSGKTTFSNHLAKSLHSFNVKTLSSDDYFKEVKPIVTAPYNGRQYADYDHPTSIDIEILHRDITQVVLSKLFDVVIIEGLMVLYFKEVREKLDLKIFVDCPSDERLVRRVKRDIHEETFEEISSEYLDLVRHRHNEFVEPLKWYADVIINGSNTSHNSIDVVREWVLSSFNKKKL
ncbi:uridine kinase family protein [Bacillus alkalicellulosilyticus]|uniref:uridine kinase family protein n=1 Tax=Alkalihalobacterium alkalicellulosilyticum TaxID=1912214 RepID=UPI000998387C|nr:AAA family ATPase [Bacillus alkalicellulosilyticus]